MCYQWTPLLFVITFENNFILFVLPETPNKRKKLGGVGRGKEAPFASYRVICVSHRRVISMYSGKGWSWPLGEVRRCVFKHHYVAKWWCNCCFHLVGELQAAASLGLSSLVGLRFSQVMWNFAVGSVNGEVGPCTHKKGAFYLEKKKNLNYQKEEN